MTKKVKNTFKKGNAAMQMRPGQQERKVYMNRNNKDFLFRYILSDRTVLLELYNALNGTNYENPKDLQITTLEDVVYLGYKNDLSFLIGNTLNLYEHQSTVNPNIPLRGLLYTAALYESCVALQEGDLYGRTLIKLPVPQYIVFYNGKEMMPEQQEMRISDAFQETAGGEAARIKPCLELTATVININQGHNKEIIDKCKKLKEYTIFVERVRFYLKSKRDSKDAVELAIEDCIENGILSDILLKNRAEVKRLLLTQFDEKKYIARQRAEAREEGWEEGREEGREEGTNRVNRLLACLLKEGKLDELEKSVADPTYQQELFRKYHID